MKAVHFTVEQLREWLHYDPATGVFTWKSMPTNYHKNRIGTVAGSTDTYGYTQIRVNKRTCLAHRLAWFYVYGKWPEMEIDHINGVRGDNRLANLREAAHSQNIMNAKTKSNNSSGFKGVSYSKGKWHPFVSVDKKLKWLGSFDTLEEAVAVRLKAAEEHYKEFARHG